MIENGTVTTIFDSSVTANTALWSAGGISLSASRLTITDGVVSNNGAEQDGGGFMNGGSLSRITVSNSTVSDNTAAQGGAIANMFSGEFTLEGTTVVSGNQASGNGGGIYNLGSTLTFHDGCAVTGNIADADTDGSGTGGGIYNEDGNISVAVGTVTGNTPDDIAP